MKRNLLNLFYGEVIIINKIIPSLQLNQHFMQFLNHDLVMKY